MLLLGVAHLQSIEFGEDSEAGFSFRHGPMVKHSSPITNIQQVSTPVGNEIGVDLNAKPAGPDSLSYNDNQDSTSTATIKFTPGLDMNRCKSIEITPYSADKARNNKVHPTWNPEQILDEVKNNLDQMIDPPSKI